MSGWSGTRRAVAAILAVGLITASCSQGSSDGGDPTTTTSPAEAALAGLNCGERPGEVGIEPGATVESTMTVDGDQRRFLLDLPADYDEGGDRPLVVNLHSLAGGAELQARYTRLAPAANQRGMVVATPQGSGGAIARWNAGFWDAPTDFSFIGTLVDQLSDALCIDTDRVFVTGLSNGAVFATQLACELYDTFAASASVAFTLFPPSCEGRPLPVLFFHGTDDAVIPFDGTDLRDGNGQLRGAIPDAPSQVEKWADNNSCDRSPATTSIGAEVTQLSYRCPDGNDVEFYRIEGGGHTWPGADPVEALGHVTTDIDATQVILDWFEAHPRT